MNLQSLCNTALSLGAYHCTVIKTEEIVFDRGFRRLCESNACGNYGKCWMCPPDAGDIDALIEEAQSFDGAMVYQTIGKLEDSYDFEGMMEAGLRHNQLAQQISEEFAKIPFAKVLHLGAGGCRVCESCAKCQNQPCRHPGQAMSSLETYGIAVSQLAEACGMKYCNGQNTVTYFGAYFYKL